LESLFFYDNSLKGTIQSSLCQLPLLDVSIDCDEITCASGCCIGGFDSGYSPCG
jgi:hypothetical protein